MHRLYAPKGVGATFIRSSTAGVEGVLQSLMHGAGHEAGRRAGTENVLLAVGLGVGCEVAGEGLPEEMEHMASLRDAISHVVEDVKPELVLYDAVRTRPPSAEMLSCAPVPDPNRIASS